MENYNKIIDLYSITPEGFGGKTEYKDKIKINASTEKEFEEKVDRAKINFALKYNIDTRLIKINREV